MRKFYRDWAIFSAFFTLVLIVLALFVLPHAYSWGPWIGATVTGWICQDSTRGWLRNRGAS